MDGERSRLAEQLEQDPILCGLFALSFDAYEATGKTLAELDEEYQREIEAEVTQ